MSDAPQPRRLAALCTAVASLLCGTAAAVAFLAAPAHQAATAGSTGTPWYGAGSSVSKQADSPWY